MTTQGLVGRSVPRVEDPRLVTGHGEFVADIALPGQLFAAFARSPVAHARIVSVDTAAAKAAPGVVAVFTGPEINAATVPLQVAAAPEGYACPQYGPLAAGKVRFAGDPIAIVVADSRAAAERARHEIDAEYSELDPVTSAQQGQGPAAALVFDELDSNIIYSHTRDHGDPERAFADADRVVRASFDGSRVTHSPIETRGGVADFDPASRQLTYRAATRTPHVVRKELATALGHPADLIRVLVPDIGGAFGSKRYMTREDLSVCFAAMRLGRPVKWIEDRWESLTASFAGRDEAIEIAAAVTADGEITALDVDITVDHGAYPLSYPASPITALMRVVIPGPYRISNLRWRERFVATNKASYCQYRGPWAPEAVARETLLDQIARELGIDRVEIRRRNMLTDADQPWSMTTGVTFDGAAARATLDRAVEAIDWDGAATAQAGPAEDRLTGVGLATFYEPAPGPPDFSQAIGFPPSPERAIARLEIDGRITLATSQNPHGQGHDTTLRQVVADEIGVSLTAVTIVRGDTETTPWSLFGTGGSRAGTMGNAAAIAARMLRGKLIAMAGTMLGRDAADLEIVDGVISVSGEDGEGMSLAALAPATYYGPPAGEEPGLRSASAFLPESGGGWSGGTHACVVSIDRDTGQVTVERYVAVEDCGRMVNPAIVEGQVRGGVVQGLGVALLENAGYDDAGLPTAATLGDYLLPTAQEIPRIVVEHIDNVLGEFDFRGVGEGGAIGAPPAIINAVSDALGGVAIDRVPMTPEYVLSLIDEMS